MIYPAPYDEMNHTMLTPKVGVAIALVRDGKIFLMRRMKAHGTGTWAVVGGHVELGESVIDAADRESKEEIGVGIIQIAPMPWTNNVMEDYHSVSLWVKAMRWTGEPMIMEPEKCDAIGWFSPRELDDIPLFPPVRQLIWEIGDDFITEI